MREEKKDEAEVDELELAGEGWSKREVVRRQEKLIKKGGPDKRRKEYIKVKMGELGLSVKVEHLLFFNVEV